jgi:hypothetical protein
LKQDEDMERMPRPAHPRRDPGSRYRSTPRATWIAAAAALALAAGCRRDEVTHFRVPKQAPLAAVESAGMDPGGMGAAHGGMAAAGGEVPAPPAPTGSGALRWTLPKGWTESLSGGAMRYATLKPAVPGRVDASVVVLPGPAGGELANVNRWRGQIGLPALQEPDLASARKTLRSRAGTVSAYDFVSEGEKRTRTIAGLLSADGNTWFVKMTGDAEAVGAARADFIRLLESLRLE